MTSKPETRTITAGLAMLTGHGSSVTPYGVVMAGALISALPLLVVFFLVQNALRRRHRHDRHEVKPNFICLIKQSIIENP